MTRRDLEARYATKDAWPLPPSGIPGGTCHNCHGAFMDNDAGRDAHEIVFGHRPRAPTDEQPATQDAPLPDE